MKLSLIICVLVFLEKIQMSRFSKAENYFFFMQSGVIQSNACISKEFSVENSTDPLIYCGALCCSFTMCWSGYHSKRTKTLSTYVWIPCIDSSKWDIWRNNQISEGTIYSYSLIWMNWMQFFCGFNSLIYWSFILL